MSLNQEAPVPSPWEVAASRFDPSLTLASLQPKQAIAQELSREADELLYGGSPYSGKSLWGIEHVIAEAQDHSNNTGLILRRIYPSLVGVRDRMKVRLKGIATWEAGEKRFVFPNDSIIKLGHLQYKDSVSSYQGDSWGCIFFEELTEFLLEQFEGLAPWNRVPPGGSPDIHPHRIATTNPGGIGHRWVKHRFIKTREGEKLPINQVYIAPPSDPDGEPVKRAFVPARTEDNPAGLAKDPGYIKRLKAGISNRGLRRALTTGDWDAIDQVEDALWEWEWLDEGRVELGHLTKIRAHKRCVAVDPSDGLENGDEYGLWGGGLGTDAVIYTTHSIPLRGSPRYMAEATLDLYREIKADALVVERNHGGRWLETVFKSLDPYVNVETVWASEGKTTRAEPVAALFEPQDVGLRFRARLEGFHLELEEELTTFTGKPGERSPNNLDAAVWGHRYLMEGGAAILKIPKDPTRSVMSGAPGRIAMGKVGR